jgi:hypothetical protein
VKTNTDEMVNHGKVDNGTSAASVYEADTAGQMLHCTVNRKRV